MKFVVYVFIGCVVVLCLFICDSDFREAASDYRDCVTTLGCITGMTICIMIWPLILAIRVVYFLCSCLTKKK